MPHDIFISYSRKDSVHALELADRLRESGADVWIDRRGIEGAERWASEIVEGIRQCSTFIVLLSPESIKSENVLRELSLASEKRKRILPVDIERIELPPAFEYAITGLQRVAVSDFEGILRAHRHGVERTISRDARKSLMILPFEDLSPAGEDNEWFADGLTGELISALSNIKSLRIPDRKTSMDLKGFRGRTSEIARDLDIRYFIEGNVRKFGQQIKISLELLDIESGDHLWQHSYRGEFRDIFDIQEKVAGEVVLGLKLHLTKDEQEKLRNRGTSIPEAYELFVKAKEYFYRHTKESFEIARQLLLGAIELDPNYANAYAFKASVLAGLFRTYSQDPALLEEAKRDASEALRLNPELWETYNSLAIIYRLEGKFDEAEHAALNYVRNAPDDPGAYFTLGFLYSNIGQFPKALDAYEEAVALDPKSLALLWNLIICCEKVGDSQRCAKWCDIALPIFERELKFKPDDEECRVQYAVLLSIAGRVEEAKVAARRFDTVTDAVALFNIACLQRKLQDLDAALETFERAINAGFRSTKHLKNFLNDEFASYSHNAEFERLKQVVEELTADTISL